MADWKPLQLDVRCSCGASMFVEFMTGGSDYFKSEAFLALAKTWIEAHRQCCAGTANRRDPVDLMLAATPPAAVARATAGARKP